MEQTRGKPFTRVTHTERKVARRNLKVTRFPTWRKRLEKRGGRYDYWHFPNARYEDEATYERITSTSTVQILSDRDRCARCGHGRAEESERVLGHRDEVTGTRRRIEYRDVEEQRHRE